MFSLLSEWTSVLFGLLPIFTSCIFLIQIYGFYGITIFHILHYFGWRPRRRFDPNLHFKDLEVIKSTLSRHVEVVSLTNIINNKIKWKFDCAWSKLPDGTSPLMVFHGTHVGNIPSIKKNGLLVPGFRSGIMVVNGAAYGIGVYTASEPSTPLSYVKGDKCQLLVCAVLPHKSKVKNQGNIHVVTDSSYILPVYLLEYKPMNGRYGAYNTVRPFMLHWIYVPPTIFMKFSTLILGIYSALSIILFVCSMSNSEFSLNSIDGLSHFHSLMETCVVMQLKLPYYLILGIWYFVYYFIYGVCYIAYCAVCWMWTFITSELVIQFVGHLVSFASWVISSTLIGSASLLIAIWNNLVTLGEKEGPQLVATMSNNLQSIL